MLALVSVLRLDNADTKRKGEKLREGVGELFKALKECNRVGPVLLLRNIMRTAYTRSTNVRRRDRAVDS